MRSTDMKKVTKIFKWKKQIKNCEGLDGCTQNCYIDYHGEGVVCKEK